MKSAMELIDRVGQVGQSGILMMGREVVVGCFGCR